MRFSSRCRRRSKGNIWIRNPLYTLRRFSIFFWKRFIIFSHVYRNPCVKIAHFTSLVPNYLRMVCSYVLKLWALWSLNPFHIVQFSSFCITRVSLYFDSKSIAILWRAGVKKINSWNDFKWKFPSWRMKDSISMVLSSWDRILDTGIIYN